MPWPLEPVPAAAISQLVASILLAIAMVIVSVVFWKKKTEQKKDGKKLK